MLKRWGKRHLAVMIALTLSLTGVGIAQAQDTSVLNFEGTVALGPGGGNLQECESNASLSCGPGDYAALVAANETLMGLPAGSIDPIGKFDGGLETVGIDLPFSQNGGVSSPFTGATGTVEVATVGGVEGLLFTIDVVGELANSWTIVKIAVKQANLGEGNFVAFGPGSVLALPSNGDLTAFIPKSEYGLYSFNIHPKTGEKTTILDVSHWTAFGVQSTTTVPEPTTLLLLGLGVVGAGIAARRMRS
jgi:hypothetical protein